MVIVRALIIAVIAAGAEPLIAALTCGPGI